MAPRTARSKDEGTGTGARYAVISPEKIPQFTGDLAQLEKDYGDLRTDASHLRSTGADVHSRFQGLSAYYEAPEAEQLFASTKPVKDRADDFATDLETVSSALSSYTTEVRPLAKKLADLKVRATTFVNSVKDDEDWQYDEDKVEEHNGIRDEITTTVAAFWAAERTCHNKITAIFGGTQMVAGDGSDRKDQYGFAADDMKNAKLPWGDPVEEKHHLWEVGHWVKSFVWDGLIVDGVWGTIKGLGTLVGFGGWEAMGQAWKGLAQLATGLAISSIPGVGNAFWTLPDEKLPSWLRDSRTAVKQTGKALVAWDEWGKNPARAAGAVTFNVVTTVFTGGAGAAASGAGKAGAVARALSVAGKAGKVIDPMTYVMKGAGAGLSKIGDVTSALKGVGKIDVPSLPDGSVHLPDGRILDPQGHLTTPDGVVDTTPVPHEAAPGLPAHWTVPAQSAHVPGAPALHAADTAGTYGPAHYAPEPPAPHTPHEPPAGPPHPTHETPAGGHGGEHQHGGDHPHGGDHDGPAHVDDAGQAVDTHQMPDAVAHHGPENPPPPGHTAPDTPGHGATGEPFEYEPIMSADDFDDLATDAEKHAVAEAELARGTSPAPSLSDEAGQMYGDSYWNDFLDDLDPSGRDALHTYSDHYYTEINGHLRGSHPNVDPGILHTIQEMDRVMGTRPVPENVMVIRGTGIDHLNLRSPLEMEGNIYGDPGYTSTAFGRTVPGPFRYKPVVMHLRVPKDTPALWIDHISANPGEREILLARGTQYKVTRVFMDDAGKWHVYGEVLPRP
ncbi:ADP-ribosyltransferase [Streptomyces griseoaurantiacus]|uniref:ADP-ribosyltransferase exoenzyme n=1 Tax=Streptomyces griseoaurantiacus TaxID=68213 RepID=A0A1G7BMW4_9ACTN|nr:ADP-ribosyltransferase [Streptomyces jietaisiensis]SDE28501.1 ADP-ribosyltransferase exoenzyme [Streptomyces jietaisiensis]